jgi:spermidine synthase
VVDLDPMMTDLGRTHPVLIEMNDHSLNHEKVSIINQDAFLFVQETQQFFDVIICDFPDPKTIEIGRLYSREFYEACRHLLRPEGWIITQAGSPYYAPKAFQCITKTMAASGFGVIQLHNQILTLGEWGWVLGARALKGEQIKSRLRQVDFSDIHTQWINREAIQAMMLFGKNFYAEDDTVVTINTIRNPVLYRYYLNGSWDLY